MILVIILVYTAVLTTHADPAIATHRLQTNLNKIQLWLKIWRMKVNETKPVQVTFTLKKKTCPPVQLNNKQLTQPDAVKYLGIHLDRKLTGRKTHIYKKKTAGSQPTQTILDHWPKIAVITGK